MMSSGVLASLCDDDEIIITPSIEAALAWTLSLCFFSFFF